MPTTAMMMDTRLIGRRPRSCDRQKCEGEVAWETCWMRLATCVQVRVHSKLGAKRVGACAQAMPIRASHATTTPCGGRPLAAQARLSST